MYINELANLGEMDKLQKTLSLPRLNFEEIENLSRFITIGKEIKSVLRHLPTKKIAGPDGFTGGFYQHLKKTQRINTNLSQIMQKIE